MTQNFLIKFSIQICRPKNLYKTQTPSPQPTAQENFLLDQIHTHWLPKYAHEGCYPENSPQRLWCALQGFLANYLCRVHWLAEGLCYWVKVSLGSDGLAKNLPRGAGTRGADQRSLGCCEKMFRFEF